MNAATIQRLFVEAEAAKLYGKRLLLLPCALDVCNGIGASWMPRGLRWLISLLNPTMAASAAIHDVSYYLGGSAGQRLDADISFLVNCARLAEHRYRWFDWRRYAVYARAFVFFVLLRLFGAAAWNYRAKEER